METNTRKLRLDVTKEPVYIRSDAEYADYDNPRGEIWDTKYFVEAEDANGSIYIHNVGFDSDLDAYMLIEQMHADKQINPDEFRFFRNNYCSPAGRADEQEEAMTERFENGDIIF